MKKLKKLKTGLISRNVSFAKLAGSIGKDFYFSQKTKVSDKASEILSKKVNLLLSELGDMKGSFLKAGQMLSLYAQELVPSELTVLFETLQSQTSYLEWNQIKKQVDQHILENLEIEEKPFAAASIGQVHKARDKHGHIYALKIQYKNIENLIETDLRILKLLLRLFKVIPRGVDLEGAFDEIREMLENEMDYLREAKFTEEFHQKMSGEFVVPKVFKEYSSRKVICTEFIEGQTLTESLESLSLDEKKNLAQNFFLIFLNEIFNLGILQSNAHMGNYLIKDKKWVLLDFGAVKVLKEETAQLYAKVIECLFNNDFQEFVEILEKYKIIDVQQSDLIFLEKYYQMICEPLGDEQYNWNETLISSRIMDMSKEMMNKVKLNFTHTDNIFVDRKIAGIYYMLKKIGASINLNTLYREFKKRNNI